ncbi:MAG: helix-turn-helix domain-containing protein [Clostridia bacterium]|nr:helix-turn-helix domain-containing protein [Clostridia bacterium]
MNEKLRQMRLSAKLTQEQLAEKMNVSRQSVAKWENGDSVPDVIKCSELAKIFDLDIEDIAAAFLIRLYASPMKGRDYMIGYTLPFAMIAFAQVIITYISGEIIALIKGEVFSVEHILLSIPLYIPSIVLFIGIGMIFGTLFNAKAATGVCSAVITAAAILGGIWMDIDAMGGAWKTVCSCLPFYHSVRYARMTLSGDYSNDMWFSFLICTVFAAVLFIIAIITFSLKMKSDKR